MSAKVQNLTLLAPAINIAEFNDYRDLTTEVPTTVYHGAEDNVIPIAPVYEQLKKCYKNLTFHRVEDDHMLHKTFMTIDWYELLNG